MKQMKLHTGCIVLSIILLITSCDNNNSPEKGKEPVAVETSIELDQRLKTTDSLVMVFYKDPYGEDSLRYTRYYKQASIIDKEEINILREQLVQPLTRLDKKRPCRSEGKIWCFTKGKIFQTLYFSTLCDDCCYVYLIKDGNFYYSRILPSVIRWLELQKPAAKELPTTGTID